MRTSKIKILLMLLAVIYSCQNEVPKKKQTTASTLFTLIPNEQTNVHFFNTVKEDVNFHALNYPYVYNGGGVAIGDVDNDGFDDIYLTSNQGSSKLYMNKGDFKFDDVTDKAKVGAEGGWTTGVSMIDINNDGWLDIYVCKSAFRDNGALRKNKLFVNQGDGILKRKL